MVSNLLAARWAPVQTQGPSKHKGSPPHARGVRSHRRSTEFRKSFWITIEQSGGGARTNCALRDEILYDSSSPNRRQERKCSSRVRCLTVRAASGNGCRSPSRGRTLEPARRECASQEPQSHAGDRSRTRAENGSGSSDGCPALSFLGPIADQSSGIQRRPIRPFRPLPGSLSRRPRRTGSGRSRRSPARRRHRS